LAVAGGVIYSGVYRDTMFEVKAGSGAELWSYNLGFAGDLYGAPMVQPAVGNGVVYTGYTSTPIPIPFYALSIGTGALLWSGTGQLSSAPIAANGVVYIGLANDLNALDGNTGHVLWRYTTTSGAGCSAVVANGKLYFCSGNNLYAFGLPSGAAVDQPSAPPELTTLQPDFTLTPSQPAAMPPGNGDN
jgi:outer membrane protein assembly factor BamB